LKTILVEDDALLRNAMLEFFLSKGCLVRAFSNAEKAMRAMENERFDIVISDHCLPGLDGVTFLARTSRSQPDTIRILLTEYPFSATPTPDAPGQTSISDVILKPFTVTELEHSLCRLLETAARERNIS
jgi:DNA-binding NtrC family response regulator